MKERTSNPTAGAGPRYAATAKISTQMVQLALQYTGRGPTKARTTIDANFVLVVLDDTLTRSKRSLVAAGEEELIRQQRRRLHELMRDEAIAIVENAVGRKVRAFLGDVAPAEGVAVDVFLLGPMAEKLALMYDGHEGHDRYEDSGGYEGRDGHDDPGGQEDSGGPEDSNGDDGSGPDGG